MSEEDEHEHEHDDHDHDHDDHDHDDHHHHDHDHHDHDHDDHHHDDHEREHAKHDHDDHDHEGHDHAGGHAHGHAGHHHGPPPPGAGKAFAVASLVNLAFVAVEVVYGVIAHSTALLADGAHNLGDVLGLLLAWGAAVLATRKRSAVRTYGMRASTVYAALINSILIVVASGGVAWEAIERFNEPASVHGGIVFVVAIVGVVVDGGSALLFTREKGHDANARAAFMHLMSDAVVGVGVAVAGLIVMATGWQWIDPVASLVVTAIIVAGTIGLLRETANLAMQGVPKHIKLADVEQFLTGLPGVMSIHDLHVWPISTSDVALTVHLVLPWPAAPPPFCSTIAHDLQKKFGIGHVTIQLEVDELACAHEVDGAL